MEMKVVNEVELGQISDGLIDVNIMDYVTMQTEQTDKTPINDNPNETEKEDQAEMLKMTEDERRQMATWNATQQEYPRDACVPQLVALQARITPEAVALVVGDQVISYQELNRRANQLAHHLQALGVRPNVLVGICVERSFDMVVGLLGIFKAGGAYVPLDPSYPPDRLAFMMHDAQVPLLVTQNHLTSRLPTEGTRWSAWIPRQIYWYSNASPNLLLSPRQMTWRTSFIPQARLAVPRVYRSLTIACST